MKITKIQQQKKRKNRYSIFLDDEFAFGINEDTLVHFRLSKGMLITEEDIIDIETREVLEESKEKALRLLSIRPRTRQEIRTRLYPAEDYIIEEVLAYLDRFDYLDDAEFAQMFLNDSLRLKGWGRIRINHELRKKGVSDEIIDNLEISYEEEKEMARDVLEKRLRHRDIEDPKEKTRTIAFMQRRGYIYPMVKELLDEITGESNYLF